MYSCGGTPKNSTKETIEGYNKLIGQLKTKLDVRIFDLTIIEVTDEILLFFDSIRIHKANKELDKHFQERQNYTPWSLNVTCWDHCSP